MGRKEERRRLPQEEGVCLFSTRLYFVRKDLLGTACILEDRKEKDRGALSGGSAVQWERVEEEEPPMVSPIELLLSLMPCTSTLYFHTHLPLSC